MRMSKEIKERINKFTKELLWEEKKKQELLNKEIDYNFLQTLINKCSDNPDLVITIHFKSGDRMVLQTKCKENNYSSAGYDGEPSVNELDVK